MSTRTIVEINHDYLAHLLEDRTFLRDLILELMSTEVTRRLNTQGPHDFLCGIRILAQRHHSETLKLEIK